LANKPVTEKLFKKQLKVSPTFLQSVLKPPSNLPGHYIDVGPKDGYRDRLFQDSKFVFKSYADPDDDPGYLPSHKLRITSKKSRRRFDINVIFSYKKVPILPTHKIPEDAELIYETTPIKMIGPGVTEEEAKLMDVGQKENPQTLKKATPTPEQEAGKKKYWCNPGTPAGKPGGCDDGYKCIDTRLIKGTCEKVVKLPKGKREVSTLPKGKREV